MLIYHPAFDAHHCVFRLLKLVAHLNDIEVSKLRILDFYVVFPGEVSKIRLNDAHQIKKTASGLLNIFHGPVNAIQTFRDMHDLQMAAINTLIASNIIDGTKAELGIIHRTTSPLPDLSVKADYLESLEQENIIFNYILNGLADLPLNGADGLKHRTGLMEFRYDNA